MERHHSAAGGHFGTYLHNAVACRRAFHHFQDTGKCCRGLGHERRKLSSPLACRRFWASANGVKRATYKSNRTCHYSNTGMVIGMPPG